MANIKVNKEGHIICPSGHDMGHIEKILYDVTHLKEANDLFKDIGSSEDLTDGSFVHYRMGYSSIGCALFMSKEEQMAQILRSRHGHDQHFINNYGQFHTPHFLELDEFICECKQCGAKVRLRPEVKLTSILVADYSRKLIKDYPVKSTEKHGWTRDPENIYNKRSNQ